MTGKPRSWMVGAVLVVLLAFLVILVGLVAAAALGLLPAA